MVWKNAHQFSGWPSGNRYSPAISISTIRPLTPGEGGLRCQSCVATITRGINAIRTLPLTSHYATSSGYLLPQLPLLVLAILDQKSELPLCGGWPPVEQFTWWKFVNVRVIYPLRSITNFVTFCFAFEWAEQRWLWNNNNIMWLGVPFSHRDLQLLQLLAASQRYLLSRGTFTRCPPLFFYFFSLFYTSTGENAIMWKLEISWLPRKTQAANTYRKPLGEMQRG